MNFLTPSQLRFLSLKILDTDEMNLGTILILCLIIPLACFVALVITALRFLPVIAGIALIMLGLGILTEWAVGPDMPISHEACVETHHGNTVCGEQVSRGY